MSCYTKIDVCNCTGAEIDLIAPETGNYTLTFRYLNRKLTYNQIVTSGSKFTNPTSFNEDATVAMSIKDSGGDAVAIGGVYTFLLNFVSCNSEGGSYDFVVLPLILEYFVEGHTDTELSLQGVDIDGTVLNYPYSADTYYIEVYLNGSKLSTNDYTFDTATGLITFTVTTNNDNIIVKLTKII